MANEKEIKKEEMTDEQANEVSGGFTVPSQAFFLPCATPGCSGKVPFGSNTVFCSKCLEEQANS